MRYLVFLLLFVFPNQLFCEVLISDYEDYEFVNNDFNLEELPFELNNPWGMTFINEETLLITEKKGNLYKINIKNKTKEKVNHDLNLIAFGQGGLLDILYYEGYVYFTYSHKVDKKSSSTAIARGNLINNTIQNLEVIFISQPGISYSDVHFGSRLAIKNNYLFASIGERGKGMIAQDPTKHPGSIIRIHLDGSIPADNPKFINKPEWLPEIYQIGVRNPQGMTLSAFDNQIYISNHGPMGGDFIGIVKHSGNYGWKEIGWGGKNYSYSQIGDGKAFKDKFDKPLLSWVPSIAPSDIVFYNHKLFSEWKGDLLVTSLKFKMLLKITINENKEPIIRKIIKNNTGRIRDVEIDNNGQIYIIIDDKNSSIFRITKDHL